MHSFPCVPESFSFTGANTRLDYIFVLSMGRSWFAWPGLGSVPLSGGHCRMGTACTSTSNLSSGSSTTRESTSRGLLANCLCMVHTKAGLCSNRGMPNSNCILDTSSLQLTSYDFSNKSKAGFLDFPD